MRTRLATPLLVALAGLIGSAGTAAAANCGAGSYGCCPQPTCDAQCCFPAATCSLKPRYQLVHDTVMEKRWHTCYQTVQETVNKQVTKTCYREECRTCYKNVQETCYRTVEQTCCRPVTETIY